MLSTLEDEIAGSPEEATTDGGGATKPDESGLVIVAMAFRTTASAGVSNRARGSIEVAM
jgi:hypothetical protein